MLRMCTCHVITSAYICIKRHDAMLCLLLLSILSYILSFQTLHENRESTAADKNILDFQFHSFIQKKIFYSHTDVETAERAKQSQERKER